MPLPAPLTPHPRPSPPPLTWALTFQDGINFSTLALPITQQSSFSALTVLQVGRQ